MRGQRAGYFATQQDTPADGNPGGLLPDGLDAEVAGQGHVRRPLPIAKALDDVLLAYEMNAEPLPPDHGAPVRPVVPGWVGVASIKWVGRIEVADHGLYSPWNTTQYRMTGPTYPPDSPPLTIQAVKSAFELPPRRVACRPAPRAHRPLVVRRGADPERALVSHPIDVHA